MEGEDDNENDGNSCKTIYTNSDDENNDGEYSEKFIRVVQNMISVVPNEYVIQFMGICKGNFIYHPLEL
ncbi:16164_t:CDS:2 [Acaulospora colombiana]|uniref:16164_t:CDS:1 n=1 Tax=Acaulospora colombiana TaxID=27376 RepID=A0ACA9MGD1_9GLOM|nr:16164_t:CDS:2 [Acaulospora colombiana]